MPVYRRQTSWRGWTAGGLSLPSIAWAAGPPLAVPRTRSRGPSLRQSKTCLQQRHRWMNRDKASDKNARKNACGQIIFTSAFPELSQKFSQVATGSLCPPIGCKPGVVNVCDSAAKYTTHWNKEEIAGLLHTTSDTITLQCMNVQHHAIWLLSAFATALCAGIDPTACTFKQEPLSTFSVASTRDRLNNFPSNSHIGQLLTHSR